MNVFLYLYEAMNISSNFCGTKCPRKLLEDRLFRVISRVSRAMILGLAVLVFGVGRIGFAESFPNRPTAYELEGIVILGKECVLGVNERCWATQYQTNPVAYYVSPPFVKTNSAGWYLDKSTMGTMASNISSLVPYYADPDTVYNGTTNITMLTVPGVWEDLEIGNHTNQFTQTFASGTNAAVYGDSPWRIYADNLMERYNVMNALQKMLIPACIGAEINFGGNFQNINKVTFSSYGPAVSTNYAPIYYYYPNVLGWADETKYTFTMDNRKCHGAGGGAYYVAVGKGNLGGVHPAENGITIILDTGNGTNIYEYSASISFLALSEYVQIVNCWWTGGNQSDYTAKYSDSEATVSAILDTSSEQVAWFALYPVLTLPFNYCK